MQIEEDETRRSGSLGNAASPAPLGLAGAPDGSIPCQATEKTERSVLVAGRVMQPRADSIAPAPDAAVHFGAASSQIRPSAEIECGGCEVGAVGNGSSARWQLLKVQAFTRSSRRMP